MSFNPFKRFITLAIVIFVVVSAVPEIAKAEDGVTSTEINFGTVFPLTGVASPGVSNYYNGISAYFSYVNENGGIYGRKLNLLKRDSQNIPTTTISASNNLLLNDNVFGFLASAPSCSAHIAYLKSLNLAARGVPDALSDCSNISAPIDGEGPISLSSSTSYNRLSYEAENLIINSYIERKFAGKGIALIYQDDDSGVSAKKVSTHRI